MTARRFYGYMLTVLGRFDEAIEIVEEIPRLDPLALQANTVVSLVYFHTGQHDRAVDVARKVLELDPEFNGPHWVIGAVHLDRGDYDRAVEEFELAADIRGTDLHLSSSLGVAYALAGEPDRAREILRDMEAKSESGYVSACGLATGSFCT